MRLTSTVDYVRFVLAAASESSVDEQGRPHLVDLLLGEDGVACGAAQSKAACETRMKLDLEGLFPDRQCAAQMCRPPSNGVVYAQTTRGDHVELFVDAKGIAKLLGAIDTPMEAWVWLVTKHYLPPGIGCDELDLIAYRTLAAGHEIRALVTTSSCKPLRQEQHTFRVAANGKVSVIKRQVVRNEREACVVSGRRPPGLRVTDASAERDLGVLFATMAQLEAASVTAFEVLERELCALDAPAALLDSVRAARNDEVDHTFRTAKLAARFGASPLSFHVAPQPLRSRFELALDNASEGCVREMFGALVASFQAARAEDPDIREQMAQIAEDETRHADLSYQLAAWLDTDLTFAERARVAERRNLALAELHAELEDPPLAQIEYAGWPTRQESEALLAAVALFEGGGPLFRL